MGLKLMSKGFKDIACSS